MRKEAFLDNWSNSEMQNFPVPPKVGFTDYMLSTISKLYKKKDLEKISQQFLDPNFKAWKVGTDFNSLGFLCRRVGDYDFVLMDLVRIAYIDFLEGQNLLSSQARSKLYYRLLSQKGTDHYKYFSMGLCRNIEDTENHILMIEIARYLTNQLLYFESGDERYNNATNGFNEWLLKHLHHFAIYDFDEINSKPYEGFTIKALSLLYDFTWNKKVKTAVGILLDYNAAKYAVQSNNLRRYPTFRRQKNYLKNSSMLFGDSTTARYSILTGDFSHLDMLDPYHRIISYGEAFGFISAISNYRVPDLVTDLIVSKRNQDIFQKIKHTGVEIYHVTDQFTISSGGVFKNYKDYFTGQNDLWAVATTVIPKGVGTRVKELLRVEGNRFKRFRNNTCVAPNFACGYNIKLPKNLPLECYKKYGDWEFIDYTSVDCPINLNYYVAIHRKKSPLGWNKNYGFFEVRLADIPFERFKESIMKSTFSLRLYGKSYYIDSKSRLIKFNVGTWNRRKYLIDYYNGKAQETNIVFWPMAKGDFIKQVRPGKFVIRNKKYPRALILDYSDPLNPKRYYK